MGTGPGTRAEPASGPDPLTRDPTMIVERTQAIARVRPPSRIVHGRRGRAGPEPKLVPDVPSPDPDPDAVQRTVPDPASMPYLVAGASPRSVPTPYPIPTPSVLPFRKVEDRTDRSEPSTPQIRVPSPYICTPPTVLEYPGLRTGGVRTPHFPLGVAKLPPNRGKRGGNFPPTPGRRGTKGMCTPPPL
jgi:hypothetical protein